ncbi:hypothetical protein HN51_063420 [Arachis hypogaea]
MRRDGQRQKCSIWHGIDGVGRIKTSSGDEEGQQVLRMSSLRRCCTDLDLEVDESGFGSTRNEAPVHSIASNAGAKGAVVVVKLLEQLNKTILI